jgi:hypothetical protein
MELNKKLSVGSTWVGRYVCSEELRHAEFQFKTRERAPANNVTKETILAALVT